MTYLFAFMASPILAQNDFSLENKAVYQRIIKLNFNESNVAPNPAPTDAYLHHLSLTLDFLLTEAPSTLEKLETKQETYLEIIEDAPDSEWKKFFLAEIKLRSAFVNVKLGNELTATWQLRQAYNLLEENIDEHPDFLPNKKTMGLLHVLLGSVPQQHQWIINLLGMTGDVQLGLNELESVASSKNVFALEASILGAAIEAYLLNQTETAAKTILSIYENHNHNDLIAYIAIAILLKNSKAAKAENIYAEAEKTQNPLLYYQGGEIYLQLGKYDHAQNSLNRFLKEFKGENFIKDASYKLFLAHWLQGNQQMADKYFEQARKIGQKLSETDKHAAKMLKQDYPNKKIMQIRLFTDGGEYNQAQKLIDNIEVNSMASEDKLELEYRKARLYHKQGKEEVAVAVYKQVIEMQQGNQYFAPNSCLQLGYIYKNQKDNKLAEHYFDRALTYSNHEYKNSINNKAKAALKEVKD